jgi:geranylgeranyl diphosphate synthase type II
MPRPEPDTKPAIDRAADLKVRLDRRLAALLPESTPGPPRLVDAMRYSLLAPGKRSRGIVACLAAAQFAATTTPAERIGAAIEMVHAASLVLDDLPTMDDAELRRGRAACHKVYGEDTATLAAIGLMNHAFHVVATDPALSDAGRAEVVRRFAAAIGADGLVGGQEQDLRDAAGLDTVEAVELMHRRKTGVLFALAAECGALAGGASPAPAAAMRRAGLDLGLAFQTFDDLLDRLSTPDRAGKDVGQDTGKATLVSLLGPSAAQRHAENRISAARHTIAAAGGDPQPVIQYVDSLAHMLAAQIAGGSS